MLPIGLARAGCRFPAIKVEEDRIFLIDGTIWSSAGMSAGIDLALAMIEKDLGREIARSVAQKLVLYHRRAGGQSQHSTLLALEPKSDRIISPCHAGKLRLPCRRMWGRTRYDKDASV